jgi:hypothetical protein
MIRSLVIANRVRVGPKAASIRAMEIKDAGVFRM